MNAYIEKDKRKKILFIGDDLRFFSGVGTIMRTIVLSTAEHFNYVIIGASINGPEIGKRLDLSGDTNKHGNLTDSSVILYPFAGYGNQEFIREVIKHEKPDAVLFITDPRYYQHLFLMEHEIRSGAIQRVDGTNKAIPLIYLSVWDSSPSCLWNYSSYTSCDGILAISKQTQNLTREVIKTIEGKIPDNKVIKYVPHGIEPKHFYPISQSDTKYDAVRDLKKQLFNGTEYNFVLLFNSRNIRRKQIPDTLLAFKTFLDGLSPEDAAKCCLVLHTQPVDENGTDLFAVREAIFGEQQDQVIFSTVKGTVEYMNALYNLADASILLSSNEGWGLSLTESLMAGTMIIANVTGGMQDQMRFEDENGNWIDFDEKFHSNHLGKYKNCGRWAIPVFPSNISLQGSVPTPYIFDDRCDFREAANAIQRVYEMSPEQREECGALGREWLISDEAMMSSEKLAENMISGIDETIEKFIPRERYEILKAGKRPLKYIKHSVSC